MAPRHQQNIASFGNRVSRARTAQRRVDDLTNSGAPGIEMEALFGFQSRSREQRVWKARRSTTLRRAILYMEVTLEDKSGENKAAAIAAAIARRNWREAQARAYTPAVDTSSPWISFEQNVPGNGEEIFTLCWKKTAYGGYYPEFGHATALKDQKDGSFQLLPAVHHRSKGTVFGCLEDNGETSTRAISTDSKWYPQFWMRIPEPIGDPEE